MTRMSGTSEPALAASEFEQRWEAFYVKIRGEETMAVSSHGEIAKPPALGRHLTVSSSPESSTQLIFCQLIPVQHLRQFTFFSEKRGSFR